MVGPKKRLQRILVSLKAYSLCRYQLDCASHSARRSASWFQRTFPYRFLAMCDCGFGFSAVSVVAVVRLLRIQRTGACYWAVQRVGRRSVAAASGFTVAFVDTVVCLLSIQRTGTCYGIVHCGGGRCVTSASDFIVAFLASVADLTRMQRNRTCYSAIHRGGRGALDEIVMGICSCDFSGHQAV